MNIIWAVVVLVCVAIVVVTLILGVSYEACCP